MDKQFNKIKDKVDNLNNITSWTDKYHEIQEIKTLIQERKNILNNLIKSINQEVEPSEFDNFDLDKVIESVKKSNSIEKQVKALTSLKEWYLNEKNKVINE